MMTLSQFWPKNANKNFLKTYKKVNFPEFERLITSLYKLEIMNECDDDFDTEEEEEAHFYGLSEEMQWVVYLKRRRSLKWVKMVMAKWIFESVSAGREQLFSLSTKREYGELTKIKIECYFFNETYESKYLSKKELSRRRLHYIPPNAKKSSKTPEKKFEKRSSKRKLAIEQYEADLDALNDSEYELKKTKSEEASNNKNFNIYCGDTLFNSISEWDHRCNVREWVADEKNEMLLDIIDEEDNVWWRENDNCSKSSETFWEQEKISGCVSDNCFELLF